MRINRKAPPPIPEIKHLLDLPPVQQNPWDDWTDEDQIRIGGLTLKERQKRDYVERAREEYARISRESLERNREANREKWVGVAILPLRMLWAILIIVGKIGLFCLNIVMILFVWEVFSSDMANKNAEAMKNINNRPF